jgi:hydroxyacylglutathione hydrolase
MDACISNICDDFYFIERGWLNGNHFVQVKPEVVLIDTGYLPGWPQTRELIEQTGADISQTRRLISTHSHCDHVGGNARVHALSGCEVAMHQVDMYFINQENGLATWWTYYNQEAEPFPVHLGLDDGDYLSLGGLDWQLIHAPGHGMGQICLFAPDTGWLISADAAWDGDFGVLTTAIEGMDAPLRQLATLERLAKLPVSVMFPGHGPIIPNGREAVQKCLARVHAYLETPLRMANDQVRKILLYGLMMNGPLDKEACLASLKGSMWYPELSLRYFGGGQEKAFMSNLDNLIQRGLVKENDGLLSCRLKR